jgi:polyhydroxyalkanoate synthesis regulator phasin
MSNDVSIDVQVRNLSGAGFATVNDKLRTLKTVAENAAAGLRTLATRAEAGALALRGMGHDASTTTRELTRLRDEARDIRVRVDFNGSADITAAAHQLRDLKSNARDAGQSLQAMGTRTGAAAAAVATLAGAADLAGHALERLRDKAAEAALALKELRARASSAATAVGSLRDRAHAAGGRVETLGTHTQTLTTHLTSLHTASTAASAGLAGLRGRVGGASSSSSSAADAVQHLTGALISLAPAAVPVAAQLGPIAAGAGAAALGMIAFGAAVIPQIKKLGDMADALGTLQAQQKAGGAVSKQALAAEQKALAALDGAPLVTRKAAAAFGGLKDDFSAWSDSLASFTLDPVVKSFAVVEGILPKLSPLAKDASAQLDRLMTLAGGGVSTPGFDRLMAKVDTFSNKVMKHAGDEVVHFSRLLSEGRADGPVSKFMDYARSEGPHVRETLQDLSTAVAHLVEGMADAGPSMLTVVDALAKLVNAVPPEALGRLLQLYTAFKLLKLSSAGVNAVSGSVGTLTTRLAALRSASAAAGGGLAGVRAALGTLSTGTKVAGAIAIVAGVALALKSLQGAGKAAPDIDKLSTSIGQLGRTGKASGELTRVYGDDLNDLTDAFKLMNKGISNNSLIQGLDKLSSGFGLFGKGPIQEAKDKINDFDESLASLVKGGHADLAAAAVDRMSAKWKAAGLPAGDFTKKLKEYKGAVADVRFEQDLTADSMGLFGKQALDVQKKLAAQKQSADGLRQSIQALNQVNRDALSAQSDFEQAIDDATAALKGHHGVLKMVNGQINLNSQKARDAYKPLSDLAAATDAATAAARDQGKSWTEVNRIYDRGREQLIKTATQMGLTTAQAKALADEILDAPDKTARLKGDITDLTEKIAAAKKKLKDMPSSKTAKIRGDAAQLKDVIRDAQARLAKLKNKSIIIRATTYYDSKGNPHQGFHEGGDYAHGGVVGAAASGGPRSRMTLVGEQGPELVDLAAGSRVHTAGETRRMLAPAAAPAAPMYITLMIGDKTLGELLVDPLRQAVASRGGIVQAALGRSR